MFSTLHGLSDKLDTLVDQKNFKYFFNLPVYLRFLWCP